MPTFGSFLTKSLEKTEEHDVVQAQATWISLTLQKSDFEHIKLLVKTKANIDLLAEHLDGEISCIQLCVLDLYKYRLVNSAYTFYINNKVDSATIL